jgi:SAM-dependent methyltransferase
MQNNLTTRQFWIDYWESKTDLVFKVPDNYPFIKLLIEIIEKNKVNNLLEIGGFPGYYSVWAKKNMEIEATLFDYVVISKIINDLEEKNGLQINSIEVIENDLFNYYSEKKYDLVISNGLIEHFEGTKNVVEKHILFLKNGGNLLITLPNFKSLNGWFQKTFDLQNYNKHNIVCMDLSLLTKICSELGLKNIEVRYDGQFMLWLENESEKPILVRIFKKAIWLPFKVFFKIFPIESKYFSPYIVVTAQKS